jgi:hypothetical protein
MVGLEEKRGFRISTYCIVLCCWGLNYVLCVMCQLSVVGCRAGVDFRF